MFYDSVQKTVDPNRLYNLSFSTNHKTTKQNKVKYSFGISQVVFYMFLFVCQDSILHSSDKFLASKYILLSVTNFANS